MIVDPSGTWFCPSGTFFDQLEDCPLVAAAEVLLFTVRARCSSQCCASDDHTLFLALVEAKWTTYMLPKLSPQYPTLLVRLGARMSMRGYLISGSEDKE
eukprot:3329608-Amphidinium_carterae.1